MNVTEYLEATNGDTVPDQKPPASDESDMDGDLLSLNDPDDIQKDLARFEELTSTALHGEISERFGVAYLSPIQEEEQPDSLKQVTGKIIAPDHRLLIDLPCRRETPCPPGVNVEELQLYPFRHVFFVVDTSSPQSYLSVEAMQALSSNCKDEDNLSTNTIPDFMDLELRTGATVEFHLSPGRNSEVNVLGGSVLKLADLSTSIKDGEFFLHFLE